VTIPKESILERIRRIKIMTSRLAEDLLAGAYHSAFKGRGMEFEEVREYSPGDEIRHIDWNVTARMQHPFIKMFREEREISVVLLIDISSSTLFGKVNNQKRDYIAELAAVLAFSASKNNDKVGAIFFSDQVEKIIAPKKGFQNVMHILDDAMVYSPKSKGSALTPALTAFGRMYPRKSICFVISDFLFNLEPKLLTLTASKHDLIALVVSDDIEHNFPEHDALIEMEDLESGQRAVLDNTMTQEYSNRYRNFIKGQQQKLLRAGGSVIVLNSSKPYLQPLQSFLRLRSRRR
jgi:uncharacterized protein (DUF58 family)